MTELLSNGEFTVMPKRSTLPRRDLELESELPSKAKSLGRVLFLFDKVEPNPSLWEFRDIIDEFNGTVIVPSILGRVEKRASERVSLAVKFGVETSHSKSESESIVDDGNDDPVASVIADTKAPLTVSTSSELIDQSISEPFSNSDGPSTNGVGVMFVCTDGVDRCRAISLEFSFIDGFRNRSDGRWFSLGPCSPRMVASRFSLMKP
jgi:hypothetical protein